MNQGIKSENNFQVILLYVFGFLLLWEWLRPLAVITDTSEVNIFVIFILVCFSCAFFKIKLLLKTIIKIVLILYLLNSVYYGGFFLKFDWVAMLISDITQSVGSILKLNWWQMSPVFRSLLFFVLLWVMSYLVLYWLIQKKRIFLFFLLSITYLSLLDTFSPYLAEGAIIRLVISGFIMLGILSFERVLLTEQLPTLPGQLKKVLIPLLVVTLISTSIGFVVPKAAPQWPDPVPFLKGYGKGGVAQSTLGSPIKKIGYGTNDSNLGGPFFGDDTPVFFATVSNRHYWRIETKDLYTGKGWEVSDKQESQTFQVENNILNWFESSVTTESNHASIKMEKEYKHIIYPAGLTKVEAEQDVFYGVNPLTEKIQASTEDSLVALDKYELSYDQPTFNIEQLKQVKAGESLESESNFVDTYTQLPENIPDRVRQLAITITEGEANRYDQVIAVERYFKENSFIYDTRNVEIPSRNQDYVDQFLFETQIGYCDNFSTSMIVLLRSVGIPSRWVKGYTAGSYEESSGNNQTVYKVTNNNAHSWVEVYFPNQGWIPFEPTKGFSNTTEFDYSAAIPAADLYEASEEESISDSEEILETEGQEDQELVKEEEKTKEAGTNFGVDIPASWIYGGVLLGVALLICLLGWKTRWKWYPLVIIQIYKRRLNERGYFQAYAVLLRHLEQSGMKRQVGQTLREYANEVDKYLDSTDMLQLTLSYERALYKRDNALEEWNQSYKLWENLIKKVSS